MGFVVKVYDMILVAAVFWRRLDQLRLNLIYQRLVVLDKKILNKLVLLFTSNTTFPCMLLFIIHIHHLTRKRFNRRSRMQSTCSICAKPIHCFIRSSTTAARGCWRRSMFLLFNDFSIFVILNHPFDMMIYRFYIFLLCSDLDDW